jgi:hypothetical protein
MMFARSTSEALLVALERGQRQKWKGERAKGWSKS